MNTKQLNAFFWAMVMLVSPALGQPRTPSLTEAAETAKSVVLVKRVHENDNLIHSYVKEIWRPGADTLPAVGAEYGRAAPYDPQAKFPERDAIVFEFGMDSAKGRFHTWRIPVTEKRRVPAFEEEVPVTDDAGAVKRMTYEPMHVDDVRAVIKRTKPKSEKSDALAGSKR